MLGVASAADDNGDMSCCRETFRVWIPMLCLFFGYSALAEESHQGWPHIRGPHYDGRSAETGLADQWPTEGPPVLWTKELGQGYSGFVIADDRAYTQYQTLTGQFVLCLDAETGQTIWRYRYDWPFQPTGMYPGPRSTPTIADDHVFFATPSGAVACLSRQGKLVWTRDLTAELGGKGTEFGYACSPTVIDGKVILPIGAVGASMVALDQADGSIVWKSGVEPEYAMDPPTYRWLWNWYVCGVVILSVAGVIAAVTAVLLRQRVTADQCRVVFVAVAVFLGIVAGTPASVATGDFVFSWPVALFALFALAIQRSEIRRPLRSPPDGTTNQSNLISRSSFVVFLIACVIYFVACRQMSLVTQWSFLWGFWAAALALVTTRYWQNRKGWHSRVIEWVMIQIAFGLFFGSTAWLLDYRYDLVWS